MKQRPNFYIILELDTSISDWATIERTIQDKRREWSLKKNQGAPSARRNAERWLKLIPEMEALFKDSASRKAEAKAAEKEKKQGDKEQLALLEQQIKMLDSTTVSKDTIKLIIKHTGGAFSEQEIEKKLKEHGIKLEAAKSKQKKKPRPKLEASKYKGIQEKLATLNLGSLYDFLNLDHTAKLSTRSSTKALYERADSIYKEISRTGKTDTDSSTKKDLTGDSKAAFKGDQEKERYDNSLADEKLSFLNNPMDLAGQDHFLSIINLEKLLGKAKKQGIKEADAMAYIEDYAKKKKWGIQKEQQTATVKLLLCGHCDTLAQSADNKHCISCGEALIQDCPKCGAPTPTENTACGQCGFHTGDAPLVKALFKEGEQSLTHGDYEQAVQYFDKALLYWTDWQPAKEAKKQAIAQQQALLKNIAYIKNLIKERKLEAAQAELDPLRKKIVLTESQALKKLIDKGLQSAKQAFDNADKLRRSGKNEEAFKGYEESLNYCVDFSLALSAMSTNPPPPPTTLNAEWLGDTLRLSWKGVKANGNITYRLIRKQEGQPANEQDGKIVAETSAVMVDDVSLTAGVPYYYALYSCRAKVLSTRFASSGPYLKLAEVTQLEYEVGNQQITIKWQVPSICHGVEVWRQENLQPERGRAGKKIVASGNSLVNSGLNNEQRYGYLIVVKFKDPTGKSEFLYSKGTTFFATPTAPPKPILDLSVERRDSIAFLKWTPISAKNTQTQIRQTQSLPEATPGQIISISKANQFGSLIPISTEGQAQATIDKQGCVFFTPLSILNETVVAGKSVSITTLDEVSNIVSQQTGRNLSLSWDWPKGASEVLVAYQYNRFPTATDDKGSIIVKITRTEYERNQCWELRSVAKKKHYFSLFVHDAISNINSNGVQFLDAMGQERTVQYKVVTKKKLFSKTPNQAWVEFTSDDSLPLQNLQLVMKVNYPPVSLQDGMLITEVDHLNFSEETARVDIPEAHIKKGYIKVFFANHQAAKEVRLLPSAKEQLKVI